MFNVHVPNRVYAANLVSTVGTDPDGNHFPLEVGTGIIALGGKVIPVHSGTLNQGKEALYGENSVQHTHRKGDIYAISNKISEIVPHISSYGTIYRLNRRTVGGFLFGPGSRGYEHKNGYSDYWEVTQQEEKFIIIRIHGNFRSMNSYVSASAWVFAYSKDYSRVASNTKSIQGYLRDLQSKANLSSKIRVLAANMASNTISPISMGNFDRFVINDMTDADVWRVVMRHSGRFKLPVDELRDHEFGRLAHQAVGSLDTLDFNGIAFVKEAIEIKSLLPPVKELKKLRKGNLKSFANVYLWIRYGLSLSFRDVKTLVEKLPSFLKSAHDMQNKKKRVRARSTRTIEGEFDRIWKVNQGMRILLDTHPTYMGTAGRAIDNLYSLDLFPTLQNFWDLIPYSFVVDWLLPLDEILNTIDTNTRIDQFRVHAVTKTYRLSSPVKLKHTDSINVFGHLEDVYFNREVSTSVPTRGIFDAFRDENTSNAFPKRIIDGSALIIQRTP